MYKGCCMVGKKSYKTFNKYDDVHRRGCFNLSFISEPHFNAPPLHVWEFSRKETSEGLSKVFQPSDRGGEHTGILLWFLSAIVQHRINMFHHLQPMTVCGALVFLQGAPRKSNKNNTLQYRIRQSAREREQVITTARENRKVPVCRVLVLYMVRWGLSLGDFSVCEGEAKDSMQVNPSLKRFRWHQSV